MSFSQPKVRLLADVLVLLQIEMMDIPPLSESPDPFLHLTAEKAQPRPQGAFPWLSPPKPGKSALGMRLEKALTPLGQIVRETPGFLPTFSIDEPK